MDAPSPEAPGPPGGAWTELRWAWAGMAETGLIFLGAFALTLGPLFHSLRETGLGAVLLGLGVGLFVWEARHRPTPRPPPASARPGGAWWKRPHPWTGRYLCVGCGWRQDEPATFCPRCRKVLARLPGAAGVPGEAPSASGERGENEPF